MDTNKTTVISGVSFDIHDGPIGISASGGADSSVLLYILMKNCSGPIHVFTCASKEKNRVAPKIVSDVISYCIDATEFKQDVYHHVFFIDTQTRETLFGGLRKIAEPMNLPFIYTAVTANPSPEVLSKFKNGNNGLASKRDPSITRPAYHKFTQNTAIYTPLFNIDKLKIKEIYDELAITDTLFPITRSCESLELKTGHCGECWWCEERKWAFGALE